MKQPQITNQMKTPQIPYLRKITTFATSLCLLAFAAVADAEPTSHPEASITGGDGDILPSGWKADKFIDTITSKISIPAGATTGGTVSLSMKEETEDGGSQIQSPSISVDEGRSVILSYVWSGENLYKEDSGGGSEQSRGYGTVEIIFVDAANKLIGEGKKRYYFKSGPQTPDQIELVSPAGTSAMRIRIGISRKGASTGAAPAFAVGDINLTSGN
jgi:hypothetical protein